MLVHAWWWTGSKRPFSLDEMLYHSLNTLWEVLSLCRQCPAACPAGPQGIHGMPGMKVRNVDEGLRLTEQLSVSNCAEALNRHWPVAFSQSYFHLNRLTIFTSWSKWFVVARDTKVCQVIPGCLERQDQRYERRFFRHVWISTSVLKHQYSYQYVNDYVYFVWSTGRVWTSWCRWSPRTNGRWCKFSLIPENNNYCMFRFHPYAQPLFRWIPNSCGWTTSLPFMT